MSTRELTRRDFVKETGTMGAGLVIAFHFPFSGRFPEGVAPEDLEPNAWIRVDPEGLLHVIYDDHEMGQGSSTGFMMMTCEELEGSWKNIVWEPTPTDPSTWVRNISTGGSTTIRLGWDPLRNAAATAREMLRSAAARRWGVEASECVARQNAIHHESSGRSLGYGELAEEAATLPVPDDPPLKDPRDFWLVGHSTDRLDLPDKVMGKTEFGMDVRLPDMLYCAVRRPREFQGTIRGVDDSAAREVPGVVDVREIEGAVAVYATDTWAAIKGMQALELDVDPGPNADQSTETLRQRCLELIQRDGEVEREEGNVRRAMNGATQVLEADYDTPFLDHAPMEPLNATVHVRGDEVEVWVPTQSASSSQQLAAEAAGVDEGNVIIHSLLTGGGFGRRLYPDEVTFAVRAAMEKDVPVQMVYTREETTRHGRYRPFTLQRLRAGLDQEGWPVAWHHRIVGPPPKSTSIGGSVNPPYTFPNFLMDCHIEDWGIPIGAWRSVGNTQTGFAVESFIDECAHAAGKDPLEYQRRLMREANPRLLNCLEMAAERADWGRSMGERQGQGLAAWTCFEGFVGMVAEVTVDQDGTVHVDRIVSVSDHGTVVNPEAVRSQFEGGIALILSHALKSGIHIEGGAAVESNFHDYQILTFQDMPKVEVYFVESLDRPGGVGEPPVPPPSPAVCNAIFAATGKRVRKLPIDKAFLAAE
jgi:isoquinoline 1-oxidoreductase beta subunit